jgi:hypothetical protein
MRIGWREKEDDGCILFDASHAAQYAALLRPTRAKNNGIRLITNVLLKVGWKDLCIIPQSHFFYLGLSNSHLSRNT